MAKYRCDEGHMPVGVPLCCAPAGEGWVRASSLLGLGAVWGEIKAAGSDMPWIVGGVRLSLRIVKHHVCAL